MKRTIALFLILVLIVATGTTAAATETTENINGNEHSVQAVYQKGTKDKTIIDVNISWDQMSFTYVGESEPVWNAEELRYEGKTTGAGWAAETGLITICNKSNAVLQAKMLYEKDSAYGDVSMCFTDEAPYIGSAYTNDNQDEEGNVCGTPCQVTIKVIPKGVLPSKAEQETVIGTITISLQPCDDVFSMLEEVGTKIGEYNIDDLTGMNRGDPYLAAEADPVALQDLVTAAMIACADETKVPEGNVAINKALTAFYGALDMVR